MGFAENLRKLRTERGITQVYMAAQLGVDKSTYNGYESGKRKPDVRRIKQIASILNVSADELLETDARTKMIEADAKMLSAITKLMQSIRVKDEHTAVYAELLELADTSTDDELRTIISIWKLLHKHSKK